MKTKGIARALALAVVLLFLSAPLIPAQVENQPSVETQTELTYYPTPVGDNAVAQKNLFVTVMSIALFVFVFVEALLLYVIFRFRNNRAVPKNEVHRGHTKAEIVWTIVPAVILLFIGVISAQTMESTDRLPDDIDFTVRAEGFQWAWNFIYPDGSSSSNLFVKEDKKVHLEVTSRDVIHAVWIPQLGVKIDAYPGRINNIWFQATEPGTYALKCAEFCYAHPTESANGHHSMNAFLNVCAADNADCLDFGEESVQDCRGAATCVVRVVNNAFVPMTTYVDPGQTVTWEWIEGVHTVTPNNPAQWGGDDGSPLQGSGTYTFTFTADGEYDYRCLPHSFPQGDGFGGMVGEVLVGTSAPAPTA